MISAQKAHQLKQAGFPQPKLSIGQIWYFQGYHQGNARHWAPIIWTGSKFVPLQPDGMDCNLNGDMKNLVYAPTFFDICKSMMPNWGNFSVRIEMAMFSPNPENDLADIWLSRQTKTA